MDQNFGKLETVAQADVGVGAKLSAQVFSDPADFLATLKADFKDISRSKSGFITQEDLAAYARSGADPKGRAAATIAAENFEDLQLMAPNIFERHQLMQHDWGISAKAIDYDLELVRGDKKLLDDHKSMERIWIAEGIAVSALGVAATISALPSIVLSGTGAYFTAAAMYGTCREIWRLNGETEKNYKEAKQEDTRAIESWIH